MSVKVMSKVWEYSQHKGSELLTLLAIADHADDNGRAYPSIARLAEKTRMTERNTQFILKKLEQSNELSLTRNEGPHGTHVFQINLKIFQGEKISGVKSFQGENQRHKSDLLQPQISPEPSLREPSVEKNSLTLFESSPGSMNGVHEPVPPGVSESEQAQPKGKRKPKPLAEDDWVRGLLAEYADRFDFEALNDDAWWTDTGNSFPDFSRAWVEPAFASLSRWLRENPRRRPRHAKGWKTRMGYSLNWYYDKQVRRETYAKYPAR